MWKSREWLQVVMIIYNLMTVTCLVINLQWERTIWTKQYHTYTIYTWNSWKNVSVVLLSPTSSHKCLVKYTWILWHDGWKPEQWRWPLLGNSTVNIFLKQWINMQQQRKCWQQCFLCSPHQGQTGKVKSVVNCKWQCMAGHVEFPVLAATT
jgi:hypothetical protein